VIYCWNNSSIVPIESVDNFAPALPERAALRFAGASRRCEDKTGGRPMGDKHVGKELREEWRQIRGLSDSRAAKGS
jgi:hypothetical protein